MAFRIVSTSGSQSFELPEGSTLLVGRAASSDIPIFDPTISRRHAKLITSGGKFYISEEVGTLNGTFVNGKRIPTGILTAIEDGNSVDFAMVKLKFKCPPAGK